MDRAWVVRRRYLWVVLGSEGFRDRVQIKFLKGTAGVPWVFLRGLKFRDGVLVGFFCIHRAWWVSF